MHRLTRSGVAVRATLAAPAAVGPAPETGAIAGHVKLTTRVCATPPPSAAYSTRW